MGKKKKLSKTASQQPLPQKNLTLWSKIQSWINAKADAMSRVCRPYALFIEIGAVILLIGAGIFFRMQDLSVWRKAEIRAFYEQQPLHTTFDAYFYLSLAKDLIDGTYHKTDEKRGVPDCPVRPYPPPLISVIAAGITKLTSWSLSWVGAVLPAILGAFLALPVYLFGRRFSGAFAGFSAALLALLYPFYVFRSSFGRFDTDCLNVTFILMSAYLFLKFSLITNWRRYVYFSLSLINFCLFLMWWDQTPAVVTALTFLPCAVALIFYYRPPRKEAIIFGSIIACGIALLVVFKGASVFAQMYNAIVALFQYISKDTSGEFPNIGVSISEQSRPSLDTIIGFTTGNVLSFLFAFTGIILLLVKKFKEFLLLGSIIVLSLLAFSYANRFIIFLVPLLALGTGFLLGTVWNLRKRFTPLFIICPLLFLFFFWPLYQENESSTQWPKLNGPTAAGMDAALHKTPENAVIWAWWDNGYALTYFARRATVNDGSIHSGERTFYCALPLVLNDFRQAANYMHFYVIRGMQGINEFCSAAGKSKNSAMALLMKILAVGPAEARNVIEQAHLQPTNQYKTTRDWLAFFYPPAQRPVYLFLDLMLTRIVYWWYWFGSWDFEKRDGIHPFFDFYTGINYKDNTITGSDGLHIDTTTGEARAGKNDVMLSRIVMRTRNELKPTEFTRKSGIVFNFFEPGGFGALMDSRIDATLFNNLYFLFTPDKNYFRLVEFSGMIYQLWEVRGDTLSSDITQ